MDENKPVIKIKKNADQPVESHYNQEERLSLKRGASSRGSSLKKKNIFFNRPIILILFNLILIYLIFVLLPGRLNAPNNEVTLQGFLVTVKSVRWENTVLVKANIRKTSGEENTVQKVSVRFSLTKGTGTASFEENLPEVSDTEIEITHLFESEEKDEEILAEITIGNEKTEIKCLPSDD
ncbi:MAG: hypothetical protein JW969_18730 [Spirochaetales bacterium]|nr:hypothetical protein [Spirochaetales bacterium]